MLPSLLYLWSLISVEINKRHYFRSYLSLSLSLSLSHTYIHIYMVSQKCIHIYFKIILNVYTFFGTPCVCDFDTKLSLSHSIYIYIYIISKSHTHTLYQVLYSVYTLCWEHVWIYYQVCVRVIFSFHKIKYDYIKFSRLWIVLIYLKRIVLCSNEKKKWSINISS